MKALPCAQTLVAVLAYVALTLWPRGAVAWEDPLNARTCTPEKFEMFPGGWPKTLDTSIYWYGPDNQAERATGNKSRFYDPTRKTVVFMDGFDGLYHVKSCHRMTSRCVPLAQCESDQTYIANEWIKKGYNFGIYFWDQFADEDCYFAAELKVWGYRYSTQADHHLHWQSYDTETKQMTRMDYPGPETSVAELCAAALRTAMPAFTGPSLQIIGFSLGGQLATACADSIAETTPKHPAVPTQLVLLEPAFTAALKPWSAMPFHACSPFMDKKRETVAWTVQAVERLFWKHNIPMALYKSSFMTRQGYAANIIFDPGTQLDDLGTLVRWTPKFCGSKFNYPCQHDVIVPFFFFNMRDAPMVLENQGPTSGQCNMPGPSCTDAEILDMAKQRRSGLAQGSQHVWKQVKGMETWTTKDDAFRWDTSTDPDPAPPPVSAPQRLYDLGGFVAGGAKNHRAVVLSALVGFFVFGFLAWVVIRQRNSHYTDVEDELEEGTE